MTYSVDVSASARAVLEALAAAQPARCRELALLLLSLEKNPEPEGSRRLMVPEKSSRVERIWKTGGFEILYRVDTAARKVEVGVLLQRRPLP